MDRIIENQAITSLVKAYCKSHSEKEILHDLYWTQIAFSRDGLLQKIADKFADYDQSDCIALMKDAALSAIQNVVLLVAFLRQSKSDVQWINFSLVQNLDTMLRSGIKEAKLPLAVHSMVLVTEFPQNVHAQCLGHGGILSTLAEIYPKESIRQGILAAKKGNARAFLFDREALDNLKVDFPVSTLDLETAEKLNAFIGNPLNETYTSIKSTDMDSIRFYPGDSEDEVSYPIPAGDSFYYLFRSAGQKNKKVRTSVVAIDDATVSLDLKKAGMPEFYISSNGKFVSDFSYGISPFISEEIYESSIPVFILDDAFSGKPNISHFIFDHIPRLLAYKNIYQGQAAVVLGEGIPYFRDALKAVGVENIIVPKGRVFSVRAPRAFITTTMFKDFSHPADRGSTSTVKSLRKAFGEPSATAATKRILISRNDASGRRILNWDKVENHLAQYGFETVVLSGMSFAAQKELFREASHVIGVHGAGLTNIIYSPDSCKILEIMPPLVASPAYWIIAGVSGQYYQAFVASDPEISTPDYKNWNHNAKYNRRDVIVDMERFSSAVEDFLKIG